MKLKRWTGKRTALLIIGLISISIGGSSAWISFMEKDELYLRLFFMLWVSINLFGLWRLVSPSYLKCMAVVRRDLTFDDLRRLVETETFSKIAFPGENRYEEPKLYVSDKWAQLNGIFIPIEWIHGIEYNLIKCKVLGATEVFFLLRNGKMIEVGKFQSEYLGDALNVLDKKLPGKEIGDRIKTKVD